MQYNLKSRSTRSVFFLIIGLSTLAVVSLLYGLLVSKDRHSKAVGQCD